MKRGRARRRNHYRKTGYPWGKIWLLSALAAAAVLYGVVEFRSGRGQEAGKVPAGTSGPGPGTGEIQAAHESSYGSSADTDDRQTEAAGPWSFRVVDIKDSVPVEIPLEWQENPDAGSTRKGMEEVAAEIAAKWDRAPVDSQMESFDKETGTYRYSEEVYGRSLDRVQLADDLAAAVKRKEKEADIQAVFQPVPPSRSQAQAKEQYKVIGTFSTTTTSNKNRNQNIRLAAEAIDGMVLKPGEEFSFNMTTGNRTSEKGYQPAGAYRNGILIEEPGGGVCQVSTTLYHAIVNSGFKTTERNNHSFAPSYIEKGQDAMVSFDGYAGPDLKFVNTGNASVGLRASFADNRLKLSIVGLPLLEDGKEVSMRSEKVRDLEPPAPVYEENPELAYGEEKVIDQAQPGSVWKSYRLLKHNGQVVEETPLYTSTYKAKAAKIQRNSAALPGQEVNGQDAAGQVPQDGNGQDAANQAPQDGNSQNPGGQENQAGNTANQDTSGSGSQSPAGQDNQNPASDGTPESTGQGQNPTIQAPGQGIPSLDISGQEVSGLESPGRYVTG